MASSLVTFVMTEGTCGAARMNSEWASTGTVATELKNDGSGGGGSVYALDTSRRLKSGRRLRKKETVGDDTRSYPWKVMRELDARELTNV